MSSGVVEGVTVGDGEGEVLLRREGGFSKGRAGDGGRHGNAFQKLFLVVMGDVIHLN